jgi:putative DNA primase/helicase
MDGKEFLRALFSIAPGRQVVLRQVPPTKTHTVGTDDLDLPELVDGSNWWYSVCPRMGTKVQSAVAIWVDVDGVDELPRERLLLAPPSAVVRSGHGFHVYWFLEAETSPTDALRIVKLARLAWDGDHQAAEVARLLRIPGTMNVKPPVSRCEVETFTGTRYKLEDLEDLMVAALVGPHWVEGQRNEIVQGLSLIGARAGWLQKRVEDIVKAVCKVTRDTERTNRLSNVALTYSKHANGDAVGMNGFTDAIGAKVVKALLDLLGYDAKDGDLRYRESVIGTAQTALQDVVRLLTIEEPKWGWCEGTLHVWTGKVWKAIEQKTLAYDVFKVLDELVTVKGGHERKRPCKPSEAEGVARIMTGMFAEDPIPEPGPSLLALENGVLDLATGEFREARMEDGIRLRLPVEFDPEAECPVWEQFLEDAAPDVKGFLQEWVGYCLRPGNFFQRMVWVYGEAGTGKSTYLSAVFNLFGKSAVTLPSQNISQYQTAMLEGAKVAMCTELSTQKFRTATFKALVSGDPVTARHPYGRPFTVQFKGKLMFGSNSLPTLDESEGVSRRLAIVPFDKVPERPDPTLASQIAGEMPGVLNWAIKGARRVDSYMEDRSWPMPFSVQDTVARYRSMSDLMDMFVREEMVFGPAMECRTREAFVRFSEFCKSMGQPAREFGAWFTEEFVRRGARVEDGLRMIGCAVMEYGKVWGVDKN